MSCYKHENKDAVDTCSVCGEWICSDCQIKDAEGRSYCTECAPAYARAAQNGPVPYGYHKGKGSGYAKPRPVPPARPVSGYRRPNGFLTFCCSMVPGIGYMYLGLMKRGLFFLCSFFFCWYLAGAFSSDVAVFGAFVIWIATFFDTFRHHHKIRAGEYVEDSFDDILLFFKRFSLPIIIVFVFDMARKFIWGSYHGFFYHYGYNGNPFRGIASLAILIGAVYLVYRFLTRRTTSAPQNNDYIDKR